MSHRPDPSGIGLHAVLIINHGNNALEHGDGFGACGLSLLRNCRSRNRTSTMAVVDDVDKLPSLALYKQYKYRNFLLN
ncbi:hypothetical protein [Microbulbifer sp. PAAF003]|uniref:hypothetical protein n=1 Tax=Microbulbifer sp. PAAF003 TaxID=3243375 RepID=UPI00403A61A8